MPIFSQLLSKIPDGTIIEVGIGLNWTAVVVESDGITRGGLASSLRGPHEHENEPAIPWAGHFRGVSALEIAGLVKSSKPELVSLGLATINALVEMPTSSFVDSNAEDIIAHYGKGKKVALIGHFPFVDSLKKKVDNLFVLEQNPQRGDFPSETAPEIIPSAEFVAITAMTLLNGTFDRLLSLCSSSALVMILGPSTPLSPIMFDYGVDIIAGSIIEKIEPVICMICEGGNFRQIHKAGVRLVAYAKPGLSLV